MRPHMLCALVVVDDVNVNKSAMSMLGRDAGDRNSPSFKAWTGVQMVALQTLLKSAHENHV